MIDETAPIEGGSALESLVRELYPICRSITGNGVRATLRIIAEHLPLQIHEVPSGTQVLDWTVPQEWNIRDAYIKNARGERVVDFNAHNLHVVSYSVPVQGRFTLAELRPHLHTLPQQPDLIPYRTSYYDASWGFCLSEKQLQALGTGPFDVLIDSTLVPGSLTYGEFLLPGATADEILISTHVCHPSLADDNLSGIAVSVFLAKWLIEQGKTRYSFRFLYAPGTIGAITWLARNRASSGSIKHGLTLTCLGDSHPFTYKRTFAGSAEIDRAMAHVLAHAGNDNQSIEFFPYGYDERQYNSPGFRLSVGSLMRGRHGQFREYHTSADNLDFVSGDRLLESLGVCREVVSLLDANRRYVNLEPFGEPQLGSRGLYRAMGGTSIPDLQFSMLWVLNMSDGKNTLLDIAERAKLGFTSVRSAAELLRQHGLLAEA